MAENAYQPNDLIFQKGDESRFAYLIREGEVEILEGFPTDPIRLALLKPGDIFGEMGLIDERPRSLAARAVTETTVDSIDREGFVELIKHDPDEAFKYLRMFFERLRAMNMRVAHGEHQEEPTPPSPSELRVTIIPKTQKSASIVNVEGADIPSFPFRIGRASSSHDPLNVNDLILPDESPFHVSRNHFSFEKGPAGVYVHDRGSYLGTIVNGNVIGGHHRGARVRLKVGENEVVVGARTSPYRFRVEVAEV